VSFILHSFDKHIPTVWGTDELLRRKWRCSLAKYWNPRVVLLDLCIFVIESCTVFDRRGMLVIKSASLPALCIHGWVLPPQNDHSIARRSLGAQHWTWSGDAATQLGGEYIKGNVPRPAGTLFDTSTPARNPIDVFSFHTFIDFPFHFIGCGLI